jgi:chitinase
MGSNIIVSSSVYLKPLYDSNGNPSTDVSGFAKVLDYMFIMHFGAHGPLLLALIPPQ